MRWLLVLIIAGIIIFLFLRRETAPPPNPAALNPPANAIAAPIPPAQAPVPAPIPAAPRPDLAGQLAAVAERAGVKLVAFQPNPGGAVVVVEWISDIATQGADFIEAAMRERLIRDFDLTPRMSARIDQGRRVFIAQYQVKF